MTFPQICEVLSSMDSLPGDLVVKICLPMQEAQDRWVLSLG